MILALQIKILIKSCCFFKTGRATDILLGKANFWYTPEIVCPKKKKTCPVYPQQAFAIKK
jgi:hypothetical protein